MGIEDHPSLLDNLEIYLPLDGDAFDKSTNDRHGTPTGVDWIDGKINQCADFQDQPDEIETTWAGILGSNPSTVSFWIKRAGVPAVRRYVLHWGAGGAGGGRRFGISAAAHANPGSISYDGIAGYTKVGVTNVCDGVWRHVVVTIDNSGDAAGLKIYIDGTEEPAYTTNGNQSIFTGSGPPLRFATELLWFVNTIWPGQFDEVGIWSRVLSFSEITDLYNDGAGLAWEAEEELVEEEVSSAFDLDMYRFLIKPIPEEDQLVGNLFVKRFLMGGQQVWQTTEDKTNAIKNLWSITECPDEYLQYLKNIVGWTSELDHITKDLDFDTLRRLISVSVPLWKSRTTEEAIIQILNVIGPARTRILNWFDLRWILDETIFSVEHQGRDPWIVNMPGPAEDQEYWSIIRMVDPGATKHQLVKDIVNLMRPAGERYLIIYLLFLDLFEIDGDASQWDIIEGSDPTVSSGKIQLTDDTQQEIITANVVGSDDWENYIVSSRVSGESSASAGFGIAFYLQSATLYYFAIIDVNANKLQLYKKTSSGAPTLITEKDFSGVLTLVADVWYGLRVQVSPDGATNRIKVYLDGELWINTTDNAITKGTAGLIHTADITMDSDMFEVQGLPVDSDTVEINY